MLHCASWDLDVSGRLEIKNMFNLTNLPHIWVLTWLCSLSPCTAHTVDPPPPVLPPSFSQRFSMSDGSQGRVLYDDSTHQQRLEHVNNTPTRQNQCYFWYNTTADCTEYFTPGGDVYVWFPEDGSCCLESCASGCREPSTPLPAPDFASACAYRGVVTNATHSPGRRVKWYSCPATFEYFVDASTDVPVAFATADKAYVGSLATTCTISSSTYSLTPPILVSTHSSIFCKPGMSCGTTPRRSTRPRSRRSSSCCPPAAAAMCAAT